MNARRRQALALRQTDVPGAIRRLNGDENLYVSCLIMFLDDPTMVQLTEAIQKKLWDDAFTAAHALKGLAGNMGFIPLMHAVGHLVIILRGGRTKDIGESVAQVRSNYRDIIDAIRENFTQTETREKPHEI